MGKKRRCLLLAVLLAFAALAPSPGLACEHYNVSVFYDQLVPAGNRVEPQVGVPGYSGTCSARIADRSASAGS